MERNGTNKLGKIPDIRSLSDHAYEILKEAIVSLKLKPGERLKVADLARELGISATPMREGLSRLEREGFVEIFPFRGAFVSEINGQSVVEIFELRALLEASAVRKAATTFSSADLKKGKAVLDEMREAFEANDIDLYLSLAQDFHETFINKCGNQTMIGVLRSFNGHLERMRKTVVRSSESIPPYLEDYRRIYRGLKNRNPEEAEKALLAHLDRVKKALLRRNGRKTNTTVKMKRKG